MFFQHVLKGIAGIDDTAANRVIDESGILCNWWHEVGMIRPEQWQAKLTERNLSWHLNRYDTIDPETSEPFRVNTPFISTTAGAVERSERLRKNIFFPPLLTAIKFATRNFSEPGYVFRAYVYTLGKQSLPLVEFSEEVRELHIYTNYFPYHHEGEIVAKIYIPSVQIERYERWEPLAGGKLRRRAPRMNPAFEAPDKYANIRGLVRRGS